MIRKTLILVSVVVLLGGGILLAAAVFSPDSVVPVDAAPSMAPGGTFDVDIRSLTTELERLPESERLDQLRDWALYALVNRLQENPNAVAEALYRVPPLRLAYLSEPFMFDYGPGRRAVLGDRTVVLVDKIDRDQTATIGRTADRLRMETGEKPKLLEVYQFDWDLSAGKLTVERLPDLTGDQVFGSQYGYVERTVAGRETFTEWLAAVDDLTYVEDREGTGVILGGRRFPGSRTLNLSVEDVAALYQAGEELKKGQAELDSALEAKRQELQSQLDAKQRAGRFRDYGSSSVRDWQKANDRLAQLMREMDDAQRDGSLGGHGLL